MAKKKDLKQSINYVCGELLAEAIAASLYGTGAHRESLQEMVEAAIVTRSDFVRRVSHPEPGMPARQYYRQLIDDFNHQVSDVIDKIGTIG